MMRRLSKCSVYKCFCPKTRRLFEGSVQWSKYGYYENEGRRRAITILMPLASNALSPKILFIRGFRRFTQPITWCLATGGEGGVLPNNRVMGMCRWMGWHFHKWIDYNGVVFQSSYLTGGGNLSRFWARG